MSDDLKKLSQRKLNFFQTMKAVAWGMFGVRKGAGYQDDISKLNPVHLAIAGVVCAVIFVTGLVMIAKFAISSLI